MTATMLETMPAAALALIEQLDPAQRRALLLPLDPRHVGDWHYVPRTRAGLPLKAMSEAQRSLLWRLVEVGLSAEGRRKAHEVTRLEGILGRIEGRPDFRDPLNYALAIFGQPSTAGLWGWRFEGHHVSLTYLIDPQRGLITTPIFFGANRATVPKGHGHDGWRVLPAETDQGFALINGIADERRKLAIIGNASPGDILTGPGREKSLRTPQGLALGAMQAAERHQALALLEVYLGNLEDGQAAIERKRIEDAGIDDVRLAWSGSLSPGREHYYRLHGPTFIIEYENSQNGANHAHTVWHNPQSQFRLDPLGHHLAHDH